MDALYDCTILIMDVRISTYIHMYLFPRQPLNDDGEIFYQSPREEGMLPISYSARDQIGYYSILPRDKVTFNITTGEEV